MVDLFTKTTMRGNIRHNLVDSVFSNTASPIGDINKSWVHLYMGAYKYLPHYKSSRVKWALELHIFYSNWSSIVINLQVLDKYGSKHTGNRENVQAKIGRTCVYISFKSIIDGCQFAGTR